MVIVTLLIYTLNCLFALAMLLPVHGERSVNTCRYLYRTYQIDLNNKQLPKRYESKLAIDSNWIFYSNLIYFFFLVY